MADRRFTNPKTGEVNDDPDIRNFDLFLRELGEGATNSELSEALWDLLQRVQDTGKAGSLTLKLAVGFDGYGRVQVKDEVSLKLPEYNRPTAILPIIERETARARAEVAGLIRAHQAAEEAYWAMADDADAETARRLAADVTRTYEALLASVEGEAETDE